MDGALNNCGVKHANYITSHFAAINRWPFNHRLPATWLAAGHRFGDSEVATTVNVNWGFMRVLCPPWELFNQLCYLLDTGHTVAKWLGKFVDVSGFCTPISTRMDEVIKEEHESGAMPNTKDITMTRSVNGVD